LTAIEGQIRRRKTTKAKAVAILSGASLAVIGLTLSLNALAPGPSARPADRFFRGPSPGPIFAYIPQFISSSASTNPAGRLVAKFKEAGLGTVLTRESITLTANGTATYACIKEGGNPPEVTNKETVNSPVRGMGSSPIRKSQTTGSLTAGPPGPGTFTCPTGQKPVLVFVSYTNVVLTGLLGDTIDIPGACLLPSVVICHRP
jgi:hypothetical protein